MAAHFYIFITGGIVSEKEIILSTNHRKMDVSTGFIIVFCVLTVFLGAQGCLYPGTCNMFKFMTWCLCPFGSLAILCNALHVLHPHNSIVLN